MFPELHTNRFLLQQIKDGDKPFIFEALSDPAVIRYYGVSYKTLEEVELQMSFYNDLWRKKTGIWWKVVERDTGEAIGACGMNNYNASHQKAEIGYWLLPKFWKKGVMSEVIPTMISHLFLHWELHRLEAVIEEGNESSCVLTEKLGFTFEGSMRDAEIKHGGRISLLMYSLLATDGARSNVADLP